MSASNTPSNGGKTLAICPRWEDGQTRRCRNKASVDVPGVGLLCRKHAKQVRYSILWDNRKLAWALENPDGL